MSLRDRVLEEVEQRTGYRVERAERLDYLEESDGERRILQRELDLLAYTALDYTGSSPQDLKATERRKMVQKSRVVWMKDPQAGAAIDLLNDFTFGRGIPKPKAHDELVQEVIDEFWDDPDNQLALTTTEAQMAVGTDLSLQSNLFFLIYDDGDDGKVKLGVLKHDRVERVVRDPDNWMRVLYYVSKEEPPVEEDYLKGEQKAPPPQGVMPRTIYYEHWRNVELAIEEADEGGRELPKLCPVSRLGDGRVFHVAVNKTTEMAFGHPTMDRLLRWYTAYNKFMDARVDIMEAAAAFVMKRKVKGTPSQLRKMATQALSRSGSFGTAHDPDVAAGPRPASILVENEGVEHEEFGIKTNSAEATGDGQMLRSMISAATRFPQSYYGDASNSNLATATSLELPVLKAVESRQEIFERIVRYAIDRAIERAVDVGRIPTELTEEERAKLAAKDPANTGVAGPDPNAQPGQPGAPTVQPGQPPLNGGPPPLQLQMAHEDAAQDEEDTERDLGYQFSMPSPLKRMLTDLIGAVANVAKTFDPNGTNVELSRTLLTIALGEGLEMEDPAREVERIFPEGYKDPMQQAMMQMQQAPPPGQDPNQQSPFGEFGGATGADGQQHPPGNPYGAPLRARPPELAMQQGRFTLYDRHGEPLLEATRSPAARRATPSVAKVNDKRQAEVDEAFEELWREISTHAVTTNGRR